MKLSIEELQKSPDGSVYETGYRIVYIYDNYYCVGEYCKTIEGFMIGFTESNPIIDDDDIPKFISIDDLLNRYLDEMCDIVGVSLYQTDGICIQTKFREKIKLKFN